MALVNCPECQREVSDQAAACPHCGHPMAGHQTNQTQKDPAKPKVNSRFKTGSIVGLIGGLGMVAVYAWGAFFGRSADSPSTYPETKIQAEALVSSGMIAVILVAAVCLIAIVAGNKMGRRSKLILSAVSLALSVFGLFSIFFPCLATSLCLFFLLLWQPILEVIGSIMMVSGAMKSDV